MARGAVTTACAIVLAASAPVVAGVPAPADTARGEVLVQPSAELVPATPGVTIVRRVVITNRTARAVRFTLGIAQVVGSHDPREVVEVRRGSRDGAAGWASLEAGTILVRAHRQVRVPVTVDVPDHAAAGSSSFAVLVERSPTDATGGRTAVFSQVAIFVVDVPGPAVERDGVARAVVHEAAPESAEVRSPRTFYVGHVRLVLDLVYRDDGARAINPAGYVAMDAPFGIEQSRTPIRPFSAYPRGAAAETIELRRVPSIGLLRPRVVLTTTSGRHVRTLPYIVIVPVWALVIGAVLVAALLALTGRMVWNRTRRNARPPGGAVA